MTFEKSAGAVVFRFKENRIYYLLLHYEAGHWGFPKGHIEKGESIEETARREIEEETDLKEIKFYPEFKKWFRYFFKSYPQGDKKERENIMKIATFLLAEAPRGEVKVSHEHSEFKWLPYKEALEQITFKKTKELLKEANNFLCSH